MYALGLPNFGRKETLWYIFAQVNFCVIARNDSFSIGDWSGSGLVFVVARIA